MPTIEVNLLDTKVTRGQKRQLAESLTEVVSKTLGSQTEEVTIIFRQIAPTDIGRSGKLAKS